MGRFGKFFENDALTESARSLAAKKRLCSQRVEKGWWQGIMSCKFIENTKRDWNFALSRNLHDASQPSASRLLYPRCPIAPPMATICVKNVKGYD